MDNDNDLKASFSGVPWVWGSPWESHRYGYGVGMGTEIPSPRQPCSFFVVAMAHCVLMLQATAGGVAPPEVVANEGDEQVKCYVLQSSFAH